MPQPMDGQRVAFNRPGKYRIRVLGLLDESWSERLGGLRIKECWPEDHERSATELVGKMNDQAELLGLLNTLYNDLHLTLLTVKLEKTM